MMKRLFKLLVLLVVIAVVLGVAYVFMNKDALARTAIEKALSYVLQVDVKVGRVKLALTDGRVDIYDLRIDNPKGYEAPEAFSSDHITVALDIESIRTSTIRMTQIGIDKPQVTLQKRNKKFNIQQLIDNASEMAGSDEGPSQGVVIEKLRVDNGEVKLTTKLLPDLVKLKLPPIELNNIGTESSVSIAQAAEMLLRTILKSTLGVAGKELPENVFKSLNEGVNLLGDELKDGKDLLKKGVDSATDKLMDSKDKLKEETSDLKKGVKNLFNRK